MTLLFSLVYRAVRQEYHPRCPLEKVFEARRTGCICILRQRIHLTVRPIQKGAYLRVHKPEPSHKIASAVIAKNRFRHHEVNRPLVLVADAPSLPSKTSSRIASRRSSNGCALAYLCSMT